MQIFYFKFVVKIIIFDCCGLNIFVYTAVVHGLMAIVYTLVDYRQRIILLLLCLNVNIRIKRQLIDD